MAVSSNGMGVLQGPVVCKLRNISPSPVSLDIPKTVIVEQSKDAEDTVQSLRHVLSFRGRHGEAERKGDDNLNLPGPSVRKN